MMGDQRFRVSSASYGLGYELRFAEFYSEDKIAIAKPVTVEAQDRNSITHNDPMMVVDKAALQTLMNELWSVGIRPEDIGTAGHLSATQSHLADMRAIAFGTLEIQKP